MEDKCTCEEDKKNLLEECLRIFPKELPDANEADIMAGTYCPVHGIVDWDIRVLRKDA